MMACIYLKNVIFRKCHYLVCYVLLLSMTYTIFHYYPIFSIPFHAVLINSTLLVTEPIHYDSLFDRITNNNISSFYYRQATRARNSSYPYISGDTFRAFSDYIYDEVRQDNLKTVKLGEVVFVKADMLSKFFGSPFKSIGKPFVLVTHNSDHSAPGQYQKYLLNQNILVWYASNPSVENHKKLIPIPIGIANGRWPQGNLDKFIYALKNHRKRWSERTSLLYVNFDLKTNKVERGKALSRASDIKNVQIVKTRITFDTYLEHIGNTKFVLSPPGNGLDCHRTWEALMMGAVPIVLTSGLNPLFANTRTVIIRDWSKLTTDFLLSLNFSLYDDIIPDVLHARYWFKKIFAHRYYH